MSDQATTVGAYQRWSWLSSGGPARWSRCARGMGFTGAPRGAVRPNSAHPHGWRKRPRGFADRTRLTPGASRASVTSTEVSNRLRTPWPTNLKPLSGEGFRMPPFQATSVIFSCWASTHPLRQIFRRHDLDFVPFGHAFIRQPLRPRPTVAAFWPQNSVFAQHESFDSRRAGNHRRAAIRRGAQRRPASRRGSAFQADRTKRRRNQRNIPKTDAFSPRCGTCRT